MPPRSELNKRYLFAIFAVCLIGGFHYGYHVAALNIPYEVLNNWQTEVANKSYSIKYYPWTMTTSMFPFGCFFGSLFTNIKFGQQKVLFYVSFITIAGQSLMNMSKETMSVVMLNTGRFLVAASAGFCSGIAPKYLWDISSEGWQRPSVIVYKSFVSLAMLFSNLVGFGFVSFNLTWILIIIIATIPTAVGIFALKFCPESPKYKFMSTQNEYSAICSLVWFRNTPNVTQYLEVIKKEENLMKLRPDLTVKNIWTKELLVCFIVAVSDQLCGFTIFIYSSSKCFGDFGLEGNLPYCGTILMTSSIVLGTIVALATFHVLKPKGLLLMSLGLIIILMSLLATITLLQFHVQELYQGWMKYITIIIVPMCGFAYGLGIYPVQGFIVLEYFDYSSRSLIAGLIRPLKYLIGCIIVPLFLMLDVTVRYYMLVLFVVFTFIFFIFIYFRMPQNFSKDAEDQQHYESRQSRVP